MVNKLQFQERLEQTISFEEKSQLYNEIKNDKKLTSLFNEILQNKTWLLNHQSLAINSIFSIYGDKEAINKVNSLSESAFFELIKRLFSKESLTDRLLKSIDQNNILEIFNLLNNPNLWVELRSKVKQFNQSLKATSDDTRKSLYYLATSASATITHELIYKSCKTIINESLLEKWDETTTFILNFCKNRPGFLKVIAGPDSLKMTPLHCLCLKGNLEMVNLLLDVYKDRPELAILAQPDWSGQTPLYYASFYLEILNTLLKAYKDRPELTILARSGNDICHYFCSKNNTEIANAFLKGFANDPDALKLFAQPNKKGWTPLHIACDKNNPEIVNGLLDVYKNSPELTILFQTNNDGWTPLHYAIDNNNHTIIEKLVDLVFEIKFPLEKILNDSDVYAYFIVNNRRLLLSHLDNFGDFESIPLTEKLSMLPLFSPNQIEEIINTMHSEQLENHLYEPILSTNQDISAANYLEQLIQSHSLNNIDQKTTEDIYSTVRDDISALRFSHWGAYVKKNPGKIQYFLPFFIDNELSCSIPFLTVDELILHIKDLSWIEQAKYIRHATRAQKNALIKDPYLLSMDKHVENTFQKWKALYQTYLDAKTIPPIQIEELTGLVLGLPLKITELNRVKSDLLVNEDASFSKEIDQKIEPLQKTLNTILQELKPIQEVFGISDTGELIDFISREPLTKPYRLPPPICHINEDTLEEFKEYYTDGTFKHPMNNNVIVNISDVTYDEEYQKVVDQQRRPPIEASDEPPQKHQKFESD